MLDLILAFHRILPGTDIDLYLRRHPEVNVIVNEAADRHGVPPALLFTVGIFESGLDSNRPNGGPFGMTHSIESQMCRRAEARCAPPSDRFARNAEAGAVELAIGRKTCGSWRGAATYLRTGKCALTTDHTDYGRRAMLLTHSLERHARPLP